MEISILAVKNGWIVSHIKNDKETVHVFIDWDDVVNYLSLLRNVKSI